MKRWLRILLLLVAIGMATTLALTATSYYLLTTTPDWYHPGRISQSERVEAANRAIQKYASLQSWAADVQAAEARQLHGTATTRYAPVNDELTVTFSQEEINGFIDAWSRQFGWDRWYGKYMKDPIVVFQDGRLVVAGRLKEIDTIASFHFEPRLDEQGHLSLKLARVLGGKLPLPSAVWAPQREKIKQALKRHLPRWRKGAKIDPVGIANDSAVYGGLAEMAIALMSDQPAEPVIFLWITNDYTGGQKDFRRIPVKLVGVRIQDHALKLTVERLDSAQREHYLRQLREPIDTPTVTFR